MPLSRKTRPDNVMRTGPRDWSPLAETPRSCDLSDACRYTDPCKILTTAEGGNATLTMNTVLARANRLLCNVLLRCSDNPE